jgi:hypothetical protein
LQAQSVAGNLLSQNHVVVVVAVAFAFADVIVAITVVVTFGALVVRLLFLVRRLWLLRDTARIAEVAVAETVISVRSSALLTITLSRVIVGAFGPQTLAPLPATLVAGNSRATLRPDL